VTKLKRDADAFAQRVRMSRHTSLFVLVEGRVNDRPFYERLLQKHQRSSTVGFSVRLVEDLSLNGRSSGGKSFALSLFSHLETRGLLAQANSEGGRFIAFALDKDFDDFDESVRRHHHIVSTKSADVESEIFRVGRLRRSVASTYGLTKVQATRVVRSKNYVISGLADLWLPWIVLRAMSVASKSRDAARYGGMSAIHEGHFGSIDVDKETSLRAAIAAQAASIGHEAKIVAAENKVRELVASGGAYEVLKGKWITKYVRHLVEAQLGNEVISVDFPPDVLTRVCLETVDFSSNWTNHYRAQFDRVLESAIVTGQKKSG
jgi:hypothetical protein